MSTPDAVEPGVVIEKMPKRQRNVFRPGLEMLEERDMPSTSAISTFMNQTVGFTIGASSSLMMTTAGHTTNTGIKVQGLFQGYDTSGTKFAFDLTGGHLNEYSPSQGWVATGAATSVVALGGTVLFTQSGTLYMATDVPGQDIALLDNVTGLSVVNNLVVVKIGSYFQADLSARLDPSTGTTTLGFNSVYINIGQFAASFLNNSVSTLQTFTKPLGSLAQAIDGPLINQPWASGFTTTWLLSQLGYSQQASAAKTFADAILAINRLVPNAVGATSWVNLGSFTAQVDGPGQLTTLGTKLISASSVASHLTGSLGSLLAQLEKIPGLQTAISDPQQLVKLITGETATLFTYTLALPQALSLQQQQQLAAIPVSPATATEFDVYANLGLNVSATATFGYDTSGFQSGVLANGFFIQNAALTGSLQAGLSGLLNEADLVGYKLTGAVTGNVTLSLVGANGSGKIYANQFHTGISVSNPTFSFGITTQLMNPQQMLTLAIQQYGPYLKTLLGEDASIAANVLNGHGITPTQIVEVLGSWYGIPPDKTASILHGLGLNLDQIGNALYNGATTDLSEIANAIYNGVTTDLGSISNALWNMGIAGYHYKDIANALYNGVTTDLSQIAGGLYHGITTSLGNIANALTVITSDAGNIASALWNMGVAGYHYKDIANALYNGVTTDLSSIASGLNVLTSDAGSIASALWNMGIAGFHYQDIANALYNGVTTDMSVVARGMYDGITTSLGNIANALSAITTDAGSIANALWNMGIAGYQYKDIANALYNGVTTDLSSIAAGLNVLTSDVGSIADALWNMGIAGYQYKDIANALYNGVTTDLSSIASGLNTITSNVGNIASALWNMGIGGFYYSDVANALYNGVTTDLSTIARGFYDGITTDLGGIAGALDGITSDPASIANALWYMGIGGYHLNDIAGALYNGVTTDLGQIAAGLWNMGVAGFQYNDIASALWNMGVGGLYLSDIAGALYNGITSDLTGIANALWTMGVGGLSYDDINNAMNNFGADASAVADAMSNFGASIGNSLSNAGNVIAGWISQL
jgi:hypothetical protein